MKTIALATSSTWPILTQDDRALLRPLADGNFQVQPAVWTDPTYDWQSCDAVIIRSCWDYHLKLTEFLDWITTVEKAGVRVYNSPATLRWNSNKTYLRDLEAKGISIVPTLWPDKTISLKNKLRDLGWRSAVVKPRVSATAYRTCLTSADNVSDGQLLLDDLVTGPGAMVQKFVEGIRFPGEWSLMFFAGTFSHAVIKTPKADDFRVQHDFGGSERIADPPRSVVEAASRVVAAVEPTPLYARVDGVESEGKFLLMELELIEPALFLTSSPGAPNRFAEAIAAALR
jgi:glutathione synthase/RimK-type ligase-like ATP-grasp enzyme